MNDFGNRLKEVMEREKISASELSRLSGIGKNLIHYYLHGKCVAKQDKVYLLAKALNVDPGWLMTGIEQTTQYDGPEKPSTEKVRVLMHNISQLDPEEVDQLTEMFNIMFSKKLKKGNDN